ncbi:MAG: VOC family protein [Clostridia bacterium]|nr:VOC family protein [Clostridia bacterium]
MDKQLTIIPYLSFRGDCEAALNAYIRAFGGEICYLSRWAAETCKTPEQIGKVMHTEFLLGSTRMAAGDSFSDTPNGAVKLMIHMSGKQEALTAVAILAEGGVLLSPLKPHPAPDDGGCGALVQDRFGYTWIITCPNPDKQ